MNRDTAGLIEGRDCAFCQRGLDNHDYHCTGGCLAEFRTRTIGFCGPAGSGKTTAGLHLVRRWRFERVRFAEPLKAMMSALGLTTAQIDGPEKETPCALLCGRTPRQAMQWLGTEWGRERLRDDFWIGAWNAAIDRLPARSARNPHTGQMDSVRLIVADDVRFANEASAIRARGGLVVRLERPGAGSASGGNHSSEQPDFEPDLIVDNSGDNAAFTASIDAIARLARRHTPNTPI